MCVDMCALLGRRRARAQRADERRTRVVQQKLPLRTVDESRRSPVLSDSKDASRVLNCRCHVASVAAVAAAATVFLPIFGERFDHEHQHARATSAKTSAINAEAARVNFEDLR